MRANQTNQPQQPEISSPKGGGAIQGINEQFQADSFTGAAGFSIPFPFPEARGISPSIAVSYTSGGGNGVCGMGGGLGIAAITRKTSNGIPKYDGTDVFLLHGSELVPKLSFDKTTSQWLPVIRNQDNWKITTYSPRIEGAFDLIEQWQDTEGYDSYWSVTSAANQVTIYGQSTAARIADPEHPGRIFSWMQETETDQAGNSIQYNYEKEDYSSNTYLKSVQYGNYSIDGVHYFAFQAVIDYGTFDPATPDVMPTGAVTRPDAFSMFISGFEIRTTRLVHYILLYHQFSGEYGGTPFLTKSMALRYGDTNTCNGSTASLSGLSFLRRISITGYQKQEEGRYTIKSMPPLEMTYTGFEPAAHSYQTLKVGDGASIPGYLSPEGYQLVDLNNDGLPGLLYSNELTSLYYEPLGEGTYSAPIVLEGFPVTRDLGNGQYAVTSLSGNGIKELVVETEEMSGYYKNTAPGKWNGFEPFERQTTEAFAANKHWVDLTGDGLADLVLFEEDAIKYYPSLRTEGYGTARRSSFRDGFPAVEDNSEEELLAFVALLGDGLQHYVRVRNGSVECWPNMGYGHFGVVRRLANAPKLDDAMDVRRLRFADIDGSGTADIIYLEHDHAKIWFNQSGNGFSDPIAIPLPVSYDQLGQVSFADVNGTGTTCMIVTVTEPEVHHYYYDFAGENKPYLLHTTQNNVGASATYIYTTSVKQYLRDKRNGRPWPTRLFFPVHVVEAAETADEVSGALHLQRFAYHDGYYDPIERTFRGFGYTESWDTDHYKAYTANASNKGFPVATVNEELYVPPVLTKSWFHTGVYTEAGRTAAFYQQEYFNGDPDFYSISGQVLGPGIIGAEAQTLRQAYAAMEGQLLRQEVYGLDGLPESENPYTVSETEVYIRLEQPLEKQRFAVFLPYVRQSMSWQYERNPTDPRVSHRFSLGIGEWGAVTQSCQVYYPRRKAEGQFVFEEQKELKITLDYASHVSSTQYGSYYLNVPVESRSYEMAGIAVPQTGYFSFEAIAQEIDKALQDVLDYPIPFSVKNPVPQARIYNWSQQYYWDAVQENALLLGQISTPLLTHHSETAVYPETAFNAFYGSSLQPADIATATGYIIHDNYYWNTGLTQYYLAGSGYYLPVKLQNDFAPAGNIALQPIQSMTYDVYYLNVVGTLDELSGTAGISVTSAIDYRMMQVWQVTDPNLNVSEVLFDPLGYVIVSTNYGTVDGKSVGNQPLSSYNHIPATVDKVMANPQQYLQNAGSYFYYDLFAWMDRRQPVCAIALQSQLYASQVIKGQDNPIKTGIVFSDGFNRSLVSKTNTVAGSTGVQDRDGNWVYTSKAGSEDWSGDRWVCSGRTIYDNKGNAAQQFESYFSDGWQFEPVSTLIANKQIVPPSVFHYDALGRVIRTDDPKGFFKATTFTPWESSTYDANDTILQSSYYIQHKAQIDKIKSKVPGEGEHLPETEINAIKQAIACYNSPATSILDTMGRSVRNMADNLGAITAGKLTPILQTAAAVQTALTGLMTAGWLIQDTTNTNVYWLTDAFQPYTPGFAADFTIGGTSSIALLNFLKEGRLTTLQQYDIQGRVLQSTDPRLLWSDLTAGTEYFNFGYQYAMSGGLMKTLSADAGPRTQLVNMFSGNVYFWDARGFCTETVYDQLQRKIQTIVSGGDGKDTKAHTVILTTFGDYAPNAAAHNLIGQPWKVFDDAGVVVSPLCGIAGEVMAQERYFRKEYKTGADWNEKAQAEVLQQVPLRSWSDHNALGLVIRSINPDGSLYLPTYNIAGQLSQIDVLFTDTGTNPVTLLKAAVYDPSGSAVYLEYGNGTAIRTTTEATTQHILNQRSYRIGTPQKGTDPRLQEIHYTYDPVGNVTARRDNSWENVFHNNQEVAPLSQYEYDLIYQLVKASGRQKKQGPETTGTTRQFMQEKGMPLKWTSPNEQQALENYTQHYTYDDGGNLLKLQHNASNKWTSAYTIAADSNRLIAAQQPVTYDANGNMQQLDHLSSITWNYQNQLVRAVAVERTTAAPDAEYYQYDSNGNRIRKVTERLMYNGSQKEIEEKYYLGPYQYKKISQVTVSEEQLTPVILLEKQTLKIGGPGGLCCITHSWTKDATGRETKDRRRIYRYQYSDILNSVGLETNADGDIISYEEYYPYGGTAFTVAANALEISLKEYRYSGQEKDSFTGLYYYGMRYYPPWLCRWINTDPAGTIDGLNLYAFVKGNPITTYDIGGMVGTKRKGSPGKKQPLKKQKTSGNGKYLSEDIPDDIPSSGPLKASFYQLGLKIGTEIMAEESSDTELLQMLTTTKSGDEGVEDNLLFRNNSLQDDNKIEAAFLAAWKNQKSTYSSHYRDAHAGMDEHIATSMVFELIHGASRSGISGEKKKDLLLGIKFISRYRLPTIMTGVNTGDGNNMQHSMGGQKTGWYRTDTNSGSSQHNYWDRNRANLVLAAGENTKETGIGRLIVMAERALSYTLASAYARTSASNIVTYDAHTKAELDEANDLRESAKRLYAFSTGVYEFKPEGATMNDPCRQSFSYVPPSPMYNQ